MKLSAIFFNHTTAKYLTVSVVAHCLILFMPALKPNLFKISSLKKSPTPLKIHSMRTVGIKDSKVEDQVLVKQKKKITKRAQKKLLTAKELAPTFTDSTIKKNIPTNKYGNKLQRKSAIKALSLNRKNIKGFLKGTSQSGSSKQFLNALGETSSVVKLEIPKGVKEDELNKHELVFYSFQKRTALNYINSFYKKLNEFELQNPHLDFPMTDRKQKMVGRVVYDRNGNIIKINVLKWAKVAKLQGFFLDVLKEMTSLPNPPDQILKDDQFTVFYALTIND